MIFVDTSVWIDHLRKPWPRLAALVESRRVAMHPMVLGELLCGRIADRARVVAEWHELPVEEPRSHEDIYDLIETQGLAGSGVGFVDVHLLGSVLGLPGARLWTRDRRLLRVAERLGVAFEAGSPDDGAGSVP